TRVDANVRFARELLFREPDREEAEQGGEFETVDSGRVAWRAEIEPTAVPDLFAVTIICEIVPGDLDGEERTVTEQFRRLRPGWSRDNERDQLHADLQERLTRYVEELNGQR